jgi:hypothetical protein
MSAKLIRRFAQSSCSGTVASAIAILGLSAAALAAQDSLEIVSPKKGDVINEGRELTLTIKPPAGRFQNISVIGEGPFALRTSISSPPYRFSYTIPADLAAGRYRLRAEGVAESGATVCSEPFEIDVEPGEKPKKVQSEWQQLRVGEHETAMLSIWGDFADGSRIDLTRSAQIAYASDRPEIAAVSAEGAVSGTAAGKARITVKYADKTIAVAVIVTAVHGP